MLSIFHKMILIGYSFTQQGAYQFCVVYIACKSCVSVNHLHLNIKTFYTYTHIVIMYNFFCNYIYMRPMQIFVKYIYIALCKCFEVYKFIYYIPLMTMPSCKSILISCECISKFYFIFFGMGHFVHVLHCFIQPYKTI